MERDDKSRFLLYIEPKKEEKSEFPVNDKLTILVSMALQKAEKGSADYDGNVSRSFLHMMQDKNIPKERYDRFKEELERNPEMFMKGGAYMGTHDTDCGECSDCHDYRLENGMITNSLAPFYLQWYRNYIKQNDIDKLKELANFYGWDCEWLRDK